LPHEAARMKNGHSYRFSILILSVCLKTYKGGYRTVTRVEGRLMGYLVERRLPCNILILRAHDGLLWK
jgi:hypothetical protein